VPESDYSELKLVISPGHFSFPLTIFRFRSAGRSEKSLQLAPAPNDQGGAIGLRVGLLA
jgi:hypothetical protein